MLMRFILVRLLQVSLLIAGVIIPAVTCFATLTITTPTGNTEFYDYTPVATSGSSNAGSGVVTVEIRDSGNTVMNNGQATVTMGFWNVSVSPVSGHTWVVGNGSVVAKRYGEDEVKVDVKFKKA